VATAVVIAGRLLPPGSADLYERLQDAVLEIGDRLGVPLACPMTESPEYLPDGATAHAVVGILCAWHQESERCAPLDPEALRDDLEIARALLDELWSALPVSWVGPAPTDLGDVALWLSQTGGLAGASALCGRLVTNDRDDDDADDWIAVLERQYGAERVFSGSSIGGESPIEAVIGKRAVQSSWLRHPPAQVLDPAIKLEPGNDLYLAVEYHDG
jgi:hypothetical protein